MSTTRVALERWWAQWLPGSPGSVIARYEEPHRRYHTTQHLVLVLNDLDAVLRYEPVDDPATVYAAAFLHDAVYDPRSSTNEAGSASLAVGLLAGWAPARIAEVERLVLTTADHAAADPAALALGDADLAVLGSEPGEYERYRVAVRAEYGHIDEQAWRVGRARVLLAFLDRPVIFRTRTLARLETQARANLTAELATLR